MVMQVSLSNKGTQPVARGHVCKFYTYYKIYTIIWEIKYDIYCDFYR